jgi:glycosyltransferase involved in cell wall biosynthesis
MLRYMVTAFWHVLTHRYDVIDCQPYAPLPAVWMACALSRQKMVATIHDTSSRPVEGRSSASVGKPVADDDQWLSSRDRFIVGPIETLLYRLPYRRIVTDTHGVRRTLARCFGVSDRRMVTVHCGIDTSAIAAAPAATEQVDVLFAGRVIPHKHVDDFLDAVAAVGAARRARGLAPLRAAVVGGGPLLNDMQARAAGLGLVPTGPADAEPHAATVEFYGSLADHAAVIGRMKSAGVLVLPSTREGFGLVLAEAMACGTPCVAYDVPAVREVLADGEAGVLVAPRDVEGLTRAIDRLLDDSSERERLVAAGRKQVAACFAADRFAEGMLAVYAS